MDTLINNEHIRNKYAVQPLVARQALNEPIDDAYRDLVKNNVTEEVEKLDEKDLNEIISLKYYNANFSILSVDDTLVN